MNTQNPALSPSVSSDVSSSVEDITAHCMHYKGADTMRSLFQLVTTSLLLVSMFALMSYCLSISYWLVLLLAVPTAGLMTRIFIFQHDCGHQSFFPWKKANDWTGRCLSLLTFTPYDFWRRAHNMHHATSGDLDRRSIGGIDTITVSEFQALSKRMQILYRLYRNPIVLLLFGTPFYVIIGQRMLYNQPTHFYEGYKSLSTESIWNSIIHTNAMLIVFYTAMGFFLGVEFLLMIYLPVLLLTTWIGGWLFYIQHQFEDTHWERNENWNREEAALMGSSYFELPKILQWFTGNIGLHHIHHLCAQIPNYKLQGCMDDKPELRDINRMTLWDSLACVHVRLWDEQKKKLVTFRDIKAAA